ncbi:MAG TPA: ATP-dependent Clp protease proteolytic subunit [Acidimicrobiales bacterium]|nr:ATP-dependent Clp protease proteolytic subunit [Acidimicrobiales bacterium]
MTPPQPPPGFRPEISPLPGSSPRWPLGRPVRPPAPEPLPTGLEWGDWVRARMFGQRTVFVSGALDDRVAGDAVAQLMTLDATGDDAVELYLDSPGGSLEAAFSVMDTIDLLGVPVHTTCLGRAEGPAVGVLAVGERRRIAAHARLRLCEPKLEIAARAADLGQVVAHHRSQLHRFQDRLAAASRKSADDIAEDMRAGRYLSASEAVAYGLADEMMTPDARIVSLGRSPRPFGFGPSR